ncbi:hypothetical protein KY330_01010 [Candidatus Woesearchaeota archaeon]|nr:hypothetical protein [Candidatus Woesearchaeota archaeon]
MGLLDLFKSKSKKNLEVPTAPPSMREVPEELPEFTEEKEISKPSFIESFEAKAVKKEQSQLEEREHLSLDKPLFIELDSFKAMVDEIGTVRRDVKNMNENLSNMAEMNIAKDKEFDKWRRTIEDVQRKLIFADKILFGR